MMCSEPLSTEAETQKLQSSASRRRLLRPPVEVVRYRRRAEAAWIRHRLRTLRADHPTRESLEGELYYLERRLEELPEATESGDEWWFHQVSLERAIEIAGACSRRAEEHAARLHELDAAWSLRDLLSMVAQQVETNVQSRGLIRYAEDYLYVFRRRESRMELVASPMDENSAHALLRQMELDDGAFDRRPTAERVEACAPLELGEGRRLRIEVDGEGFWVSMESPRVGRFTYAVAFPRFEDARAYVRGTLREDVLAGRILGAGDWQQNAPADPAAERAERRAIAQRQRLAGRSLWSLLTSVPGYRTVYREEVSERVSPWQRLPPS